MFGNVGTMATARGCVTLTAYCQRRAVSAVIYWGSSKSCKAVNLAVNAKLFRSFFSLKSSAKMCQYSMLVLFVSFFLLSNFLGTTFQSGIVPKVFFRFPPYLVHIKG